MGSGLHFPRDFWKSVSLAGASDFLVDSRCNSLAQGMYDSWAFARMLELADPMEWAGCDHGKILSHCRGPGPHVRGCWVVDLLLGKE
jgi:hypothetical protein